MPSAPSNQTSSLRIERRKKRQRQKQLTRLWWGLGAFAVLALVGFTIWISARPSLGEEIPATGENSHVPENSPLPPFSTDPPTSGTHYPTWWEAGFYDEDSPEATSVPFPAGYLVHNLEHGYVIFWYNCTLLSAEACASLKAELRDLIEKANHFKVIAFPWTTTDVPVVATSWGRLLKMEQFDRTLAEEMIRRNRNRAPEPNAP